MKSKKKQIIEDLNTQKADVKSAQSEKKPSDEKHKIRVFQVDLNAQIQADDDQKLINSPNEHDRGDGGNGQEKESDNFDKLNDIPPQQRSQNMDLANPTMSSNLQESNTSARIYSSQNNPSLNSALENKNDKNLKKDPESEKVKEHEFLTYFDKSGMDRLMQQYNVLHGDINLVSSPFNCIYPLIDMNRHIINTFFLVFVSEYPLLQMIVLSTTNCFVLTYSLILRPFRQIKVLIITFVNETIVCLICLCTAYLCILDKNNDLDLSKRFKIGKVILYSNMILNFFFSIIFFIDLIFLLIYSVFTIKAYYDELKQLRKVEKTKKNLSKKTTLASSK